VAIAGRLTDTTESKRHSRCERTAFLRRTWTQPRWSGRSFLPMPGA